MAAAPVARAASASTAHSADCGAALPRRRRPAGGLGWRLAAATAVVAAVAACTEVGASVLAEAGTAAHARRPRRDPSEPPLTPEAAVVSAGVVLDTVLRVPAAGAHALWSGLGRLESLPLLPLARRLEALASPPPAAAAGALARACAALNATMPCPKLLVLPHVRKPRLMTLARVPWLRAERASLVVFATGGLLEAAGSAELTALFAREVALAEMNHPPLPEVWAAKAALLPRPRASPQRRYRGEEEGSEQAIKVACKEFVELCRAHYGLGLMAQHAHQLPVQLQAPVLELARLRPPWPLSDALDAVGMKVETGRFSGPIKLALGRARELEEELQLRRYVKGGAPSVQATWKKLRAFRPTGPPGSSRQATSQPGLLALPKSWAQAKKRKPASPAKLVLAGWLAARRWEEAAADRLAAEAVGSIAPVAAGLVILYGTDTDRRRLGRGELPGLLEDCQAEQSPRRRWGTWWTSVVMKKQRPPLYIRLAELADWATSEEGKSRLPRGRFEVWWEWLLELFRRALGRLRPRR